MRRTPRRVVPPASRGRTRRSRRACRPRRRRSRGSITRRRSSSTPSTGSSGADQRGATLHRDPLPASADHHDDRRVATEVGQPARVARRRRTRPTRRRSPGAGTTPAFTTEVCGVRSGSPGDHDAQAVFQRYQPREAGEVGAHGRALPQPVDARQTDQRQQHTGGHQSGRQASVGTPVRAVRGSGLAGAGDRPGALGRAGRGRSRGRPPPGRGPRRRVEGAQRRQSPRTGARASDDDCWTRRSPPRETPEYAGSCWPRPLPASEPALLPAQWVPDGARRPRRVHPCDRAPGRDRAPTGSRCATRCG